MVAMRSPDWIRARGEAVHTALIITRRELRDSLRDWRIMVPILILTLIFPWLMDVTAKLAVDFVTSHDAPIVGERLIPFLLMIVGFFPISFSLVIALETFVGEKERNSLEPLLAMPISDSELYLGKMLAALTLPLLASALGIGIYLIGLLWSLHYLPPAPLLVQILSLTAAQALVMVSGAVVVSSQTTSVRAANLLASFIIIPMALLVQGESIIMFWGRYEVLWWILAGLLVVDLVLVRMGVRIFNREDILAKEIDQINLRAIWHSFRGYFLRPPEAATRASEQGWRFDLPRIYRHDIPRLLLMQRLPILAVVLTVLVGGLLGWHYAHIYPLPGGGLRLEQLPADTFQNIPAIPLLPSFDISGIFTNNLRALVLALLLGIFSFGALALILLMIPVGMVGFFTAQAALLGYNPWLFLFAFFLPHGIVEMPVAMIATAFALRVGASVVSPPAGLDVGQGLLLALADFVKVFCFLVVPFLLLAAVLEVHLTPQVVLFFYGVR
jgi:uncharacterized membrane protein SpoIIM required for sporulation/ABC-type transport system involved in multi-copper enzyme maturation permease subunit